MENSQLEKAKAIILEVSRILGTEEVYLVGGATRDIVMNQHVKDWDFCTSMLPEEITEMVKKAGRRVYTIGEKFGTIGFKVQVEEEVPLVDYSGFEPDTPTPSAGLTRTVPKFEYVEVTTFRSEVYTNKSRKPEVKFVPSLDEDLARRDFTMNAMVLRSDGSIYDPYGGKLDIYAKQIKTVGMPKDRILEDPLRIFRAARFAARYGFTIDPNFIGKARQLADRIYDVSIERWVQELDKLFTAESANVGLEALHDMGLLQRILPELYDSDSRAIPFDSQTKQYTDANEAWKYVLGNILVPDSVKEPSHTIRYVNSGICRRFKFSNDRTDFILDKHKEKV